MVKTTTPIFVTARTAFLGVLNGREVEVHAGEVFAADDPVVDHWPQHFEPLVVRTDFARRPVEQATAAPGEKRN